MEIKKPKSFNSHKILSKYPKEVVEAYEKILDRHDGTTTGLAYYFKREAIRGFARLGDKEVFIVSLHSVPLLINDTDYCLRQMSLIMDNLDFERWT